MADAFYVPLGDERYGATEHTTGPWAPGAQHFGPPSALLARGLERLEAPHPSLIARVTIEILGPAPVAELDQRSWIERPGRSVELLQSELSAGGKLIARASAWRIGTVDTADVATDAGPLLPSADAGTETKFPEDWTGGYLDAVEWRAVRGSITTPGPAAVWGRQRIPLVDGEEPTGLQRLFAVADSANGVSHFLSARDWLFINSELTVHLRRAPEGEWIGLDAVTLVGPHGVGTAASTLHDGSGPVGTGAQALLVRPRQAGGG
ncbi:thioesterase family protein [Amycolatopsis rhabdoformis]|uniref:Thioesterase family protein n=1 Tax=Amycolatopsis rhabdoformis TaxID=1448059 RepID=A0ABZ1IG54_9PSEU|nr:thioesterase family protein [Amycolatopsis rhabdoformis]WSE33084.1 thioesterase family protein [Amycolatopsis rhabdoformis]